MNRDAPSPPSRAARLTRSLAGADDAVNRVHDRLNAAIPWLWTPLAVPAAARRLGAAEHALYGAHAAAGLGVVTALVPRRARRPALAVGGLVAVVSWAVFTGAWDRRADAAQTDDDAARCAR